MDSTTIQDDRHNIHYTYHGQSPIFIAAPTILIIIAAILVALRCWTNLKIVGRFSASELVLVAAVMSGLASLITWLVSRTEESKYPPGSEELFENLAWTLVVSHTLYILTSTLTKSYAALYLLPTCLIPWQRRIYICGMAILMLFNGTTVFVSIFRCGSVNAVTLMQSESCAINFDTIGPLLITSTVLTVTTEWFFAAVPLYTLWRTGGGQLYVFFFGTPLNFFANFFAIGGMFVCLVRIKFVPGLKPNSQVFETFPEAYILGSIESSMCIASLSLCALHPLVDRYKRWNRSRIERNQPRPRTPRALEVEKPSSPSSPSQDLSTVSTNEPSDTYRSPKPRRDSKFSPDDSNNPPSSPKEKTHHGFIPSTIASSTQSLDLESGSTNPTLNVARRGFYSVMPRIGILPDTSLTTTNSYESVGDENEGDDFVVTPDPGKIIWRWDGRNKEGTLQSISEVRDEQ